MEEKALANSSFSLESAVTAAVKLPGVKVNRNKFLSDVFSKQEDRLSDIVTLGPIDANIDREQLAKLAKKQILLRTSESSAVSFAAGLPGGFAMAATVPADVLQFFGMALRLAQEISYLYGAKDLWQDGELDDERIRNQLIIYIGVMFGVSGASAGLRVLSTQIADTTLRRLPKKALTKTFWYPLIKKICHKIGIDVTKETFAKGVSKVIPIVGGVISGGLTFASMMPMANRLQGVFDKSCFDYTQEEFEEDCVVIENTQEETPEPQEQKTKQIKSKVEDSAKTVKNKLIGIGSKVGGLTKKSPEKPKEQHSADEDVFSALEKLKKLEESGVISPEEFAEKKKELLSRI